MIDIRSEKLMFKNQSFRIKIEKITLNTMTINFDNLIIIINTRNKMNKVYLLIIF